MRKLPILIVLLFVIGCGPSREDRMARLEERKERIKTNSDAQVYLSAYSGLAVEIMKVKDCEYVLWHNSYGSDMEHYEGCNNNKHK